VGEVGEEVDLCDVAGGLADAGGVGEELAAEFGEDAALDFAGALLCGQDFYFELFELGGGEAFGVDEGLFALVVGGNGLGVGLGYFEVVAEDRVKADFEGGDTGAFALTFLDGGDTLASCGGEVAEFVELGVDGFADGAAVASGYGWFVDEGAGDEFVEVFERVEGGG
jgi:hypothetical protein